LKAQAQRNLENSDARIRRWWCRKYSSPATDPRFTGRSIAEWTIELLEDTYERREEVKHQIESGQVKFSDGEAILRRLSEALGEQPTGYDPLIDEWERDLAEGRVPDLDKRG
jgi:hypothetical protein